MQLVYMLFPMLTCALEIYLMINPIFFIVVLLAQSSSGLFSLKYLAPTAQINFRGLPGWGGSEVGAFYWTVLAPDIVNPGREEQDSFSM
jgi:thiol:disulfide interchange protein